MMTEKRLSIMEQNDMSILDDPDLQSGKAVNKLAVDNKADFSAYF